MADPVFAGSEGGSASPPAADLATLVAAFAVRLRDAGVEAGPVQSARFAAALGIAGPTDVSSLYWLARISMLDSVVQLDAFDAVFDAVFRGRSDVADYRGDRPPAVSSPAPESGPAGAPRRDPTLPDTDADGTSVVPRPVVAGDETAAGTDGAGILAAASDRELLLHKNFADCTAEELAELERWTGRWRIVPPTRPAGWLPARRAGRYDLRRTLRASHRTGGDPIDRRYRRRGSVQRRVVVLADVSGSMQAYARAYLRLLRGAVLGSKAEAFVFATRLTRVTRRLRATAVHEAINRAVADAPDYAGGTRIGAALKAFLDTDGRRGLARGAVVVIISDGWERADPALLAEQMDRLKRLAYRVIWVNPRKAAAGFAPLTGGMAAALPAVDVFVSGHSMSAMAEVLDAVAGCATRHRAG